MADKDKLDTPRYRRASWMSDLRNEIGPFPITDIRIPGTHDTATHNIRARSDFGGAAPGLLGKRSNPMGSIARFFAGPTSSKWSKCHSMSVHEQLKFGIRYMDWRLTPHPEDANRLWTEHAQLSVSLQTVLAELVLFLSSPTSKDEFVVVDIQHVSGVDDADLSVLLFDALAAIKDRCVPNTTPLNTPLSTLWSRDPMQRIFLVIGRNFNASAFPFAFVRSQHLASSWKNKASPEALVEALNKDVKELPEYSRNTPRQFSTRICVSQCVCSPNTSQIAKSVFKIEALSSEENMYQLAMKTNSPVLQWFWAWNGRNELNDGTYKEPHDNTHRNVIMIDYPEMGRARIHWDGYEREMDVVHMCCLLNSLLVPQNTKESLF